MKTIYIVVYSYGTWEDATRESIRAYYDENLANNFVAHKNKAIKLACDFSKKLANLPEKFSIPAFTEKEPRKDELPEFHFLRNIQQTHPDKAARKKAHADWNTILVGFDEKWGNWSKRRDAHHEEWQAKKEEFEMNQFQKLLNETSFEESFKDEVLELLKSGSYAYNNNNSYEIDEVKLHEK